MISPFPQISCNSNIKNLLIFSFEIKEKTRKIYINTAAWVQISKSLELGGLINHVKSCKQKI